MSDKIQLDSSDSNKRRMMLGETLKMATSMPITTSAIPTKSRIKAITTATKAGERILKRIIIVRILTISGISSKRRGDLLKRSSEPCAKSVEKPPSSESLPKRTERSQKSR